MAFTENTLVSGLLVFYYRNGVTNHETCFNRVFSGYQGNSYLLHIALEEAQKDGYEYFNWGASETRECGVYKFKEAWGAREIGYSYFTRMIGDCTVSRRVGALEIQEKFSRFYYVIPFTWLDG